MSRVAYVDVVSGAAGDMLLSALIDAGASEPDVRAAVARVLPAGPSFGTEHVRRGGLRARWLRIQDGRAGPGPTDGRRTMSDLVRIVEAAELSPQVEQRALTVLRALGGAEAAVHGLDEGGASDGHHLHELGDDDTLIDVVGIAAALDSLRIADLLVSSVPLALARSGSVSAGHGGMPAPGPATLHLLRGFDVRGAPGGAERVTPTAAAVFAGLGRPAGVLPGLRLDGVGYGAGTRDPSDEPNIVRVLIGTPAAEPHVRDEELVVLEANIDDLAPELVADAAAALMDAGALDAWIVPTVMKKGRSGVVLSALAAPHTVARLKTVFFEASSTFGVRFHGVTRTALERDTIRVEVGGGAVDAKVGRLAGRVLTVKPEHDQVADLARRIGRSVRSVHDEARQEAWTASGGTHTQASVAKEPDA